MVDDPRRRRRPQQPRSLSLHAINNLANLAVRRGLGAEG